jgi:hypothetical protein
MQKATLYRKTTDNAYLQRPGIVRNLLGEHGPRHNPDRASGNHFTVKEKIDKCLALWYLGDFFTCHWTVRYRLTLNQPPET